MIPRISTPCNPHDIGLRIISWPGFSTRSSTFKDQSIKRATQKTRLLHPLYFAALKHGVLWSEHFKKIQNSFKYKEGFFIHTDCYHIHDRVSPCGNSNFDSQFITLDHSVAHCIQSCRIFELWNTENMAFFQSVRISKTNVNFKKDWPT